MMSPNESSITHECSLCHVYFSNYSAALIHLEIKHSDYSETCKIETLDNDIQRNGLSGSGNDDTRTRVLLKSVQFPESIVILDRISTRTNVKMHALDLKTRKKRGVKNPKDQIKNDSSRCEIKLDSLKAEEIETLVADLFSDVSHPRDETLVRRSHRKVKAPLNINYGDLNSEDEANSDSSQSKRKKSKPQAGVYKTSRSARPGTSNRSDATVSKLSKSNVKGNDKYLDICRICELDFSDFPNRMSGYLKHMRDEHLKDGKYTCPLCSMFFYQLKQFNNHVNEHDLPTKIYTKPEVKDYHTCKICGKVLTNLYMYSMEQHMKTHEMKSADDESKPFECPVCHHKFSQKTGLQRHLFLHLENNPFKCVVVGCGKAFNSDYNLKRHNAVHTNRFHECKHCHGKFSRIESLKRHVNKFHSSSSNGFKIRSQRSYIKSTPELDLQNPNPPCKGDPDAEKDKVDHNNINSTGTGTRLKMSEIVQSDPVLKRVEEENPEGLKTLKSDVLDNWNSYNRHRKIDDFKCQICPDTFARAFSLQQHMQNVHGAVTKLPSLDNANSLTCERCGYSSKSEAKLTAHISEVHLQDRNFPCSYCQRRFTKSTRRDKHIRKIHLTKPKFQCDKCPANYHTRRALDQHFSHKHDPEYQKVLEKTCKCSKCGKVLGTRKAYRIHMKLHTDPQREVVSCNFCGQNCASADSLKRHVKFVHLGVKNPNSRLNSHLSRKAVKNVVSETSVVIVKSEPVDITAEPNF